ncbi:MAG TPA: O-antigen ligase family protein [Terriglobia bacterium]|nr:O-antigen ligase family protein [Terriglobia bacterium]
MQTSLECRVPAINTRRWIREVPAASTDGPKISFKLLILFLLMLYSNVAVIFKQLDVFRPVQVVAVAAIIMMVVELGMARQRFRLAWPQSLLLLAFLGIAALSSFSAIYARQAFNTTADFSKVILIYLLIENTVTTEKRLRAVLLTLLIGGMLPAVGTINNYMHGVLVEGSRAAWRGIFANPNEDAYSLLILIPIAASIAGISRWHMRIALWGMIGVYLLAIFLTFSRGGLLGLFAVLGLMGWKQKSFIIRAGMIAVLLGGIAVAGMFWTRKDGFKDLRSDTTVRQRFATYEAGALMFAANPLLGVGPGCSLVAYPLYVPRDAHCGCQDQLVIHNSFIQVLSELGSLGFIPWMVFLGAAVFQVRKLQTGRLAPYATCLEIALFGFLASSMAGGFAYTWWPYILVALITATKHISDSRIAENAVQ